MLVISYYALSGKVLMKKQKWENFYSFPKYFLETLSDQHSKWKGHLKLTENKIAKHIAILYKVRPYLDKGTLLASTTRIFSPT